MPRARARVRRRQRDRREQQAILAADAPWNDAIARFDPGGFASAGPPCSALDFAREGLSGNPQSGDWGDWPATSPLGFDASSIASFTHAPFPITFVRADDPRPAHSPEATALLARNDASVDTLRSTDVLVRLDDVVEPELGTHEHYTPGAITARVLVFDHAHNAIACAGIVHVASSPTVDPGSSNLDDDLMINFMRALPAGVHAISP